MAVTLRKYLNSKLKEKGLTVKEAQKNAGKYKSIAAAKKAGSLYYTNKDGKVMAAVYAEDLKKPLTSSPRPKSKPKKLGAGTRPKVTVTPLVPGTSKTLDEIFAKLKKKKKNLKGRNDTTKRKSRKDR